MKAHNQHTHTFTELKMRKKRNEKGNMAFFSLSSRLSPLPLLSLLLSSSFEVSVLFVEGTIDCKPNDPIKGDKWCVLKYGRNESYCMPDLNICSNPFRKGCLRTVLPEIYADKLRTCNSDDNIDNEKITTEEGKEHENNETDVWCVPSELNYEEVRILNQDWESAMFSSWIMQIVLSELLNVPTTIETSTNDTDGSFNFYDEEMRFTYSAKSYDYEALRNALQEGDCVQYRKKIKDKKRKQQQNNNSYEEVADYEPCAHIIPEVWNGQFKKLAEIENEGLIEPTTSSGGIAKYSWYVPKFTAERNPGLLSHFGLRMKNSNKTLSSTENADYANDVRRLLANTFLRPTTWNDYCTQVTSNNCTTPPYYDDDGRMIVSEAPPTLDKGNKYFVLDKYHGHFRKTDDNDCDSFPQNCTGHISNVQCDWSTFVIPQAHYHSIPVKGNGPKDPAGGYSYPRMVEIYNAANYTKSNVLMYWFNPDTLIQDYMGTDAEFQRILLPPATEECIEARVTEEQRCSNDVLERVGIEQGSCDAEAHLLQKVIVRNMFSRYHNQTIDVIRSPAYDTIKAMRLSDLEVEYMFRKWYEPNVDRQNYDPRDAVCTWVGENIDKLKRYLPQSYPRTIRIKKYDQPILYVAMAVAIISLLLTVVMAISTYHYQKKKIILYAQPNFLYLLISGLFLICIGSILYAMTPTKGTCVGRQWFVLLGYSLELIPLIMKVAAINAIYQSAIKLKRVRIRTGLLFASVGMFIGSVVIYLIVWSLLDPSTIRSNKTLTDDVNEENGQVIEINDTCESNSSAWLISAYCYQFLLLIAATVLAFQNRNVKQEFNESNQLGFVIYGHFLVLLLRAIIWIFGSHIKDNVANASISFLLSADVIGTICIYFLPKILIAMKPQPDYTLSKRITAYSFSGGSGSMHMMVNDDDLSSVDKIRLGAAREMEEWKSNSEVTRRGSNDSTTGSSIGRGSDTKRRLSFQGSTITGSDIESDKEVCFAAENDAENEESSGRSGYECSTATDVTDQLSDHARAVRRLSWTSNVSRESENRRRMSISSIAESEMESDEESFAATENDAGIGESNCRGGKACSTATNVTDQRSSCEFMEATHNSAVRRLSWTGNVSRESESRRRMSTSSLAESEIKSDEESFVAAESDAEIGESNGRGGKACSTATNVTDQRSSGEFMDHARTGRRLSCYRKVGKQSESRRRMSLQGLFQGLVMAESDIESDEELYDAAENDAENGESNGRGCEENIVDDEYKKN